MGVIPLEDNNGSNTGLAFLRKCLHTSALDDNATQTMTAITGLRHQPQVSADTGKKPEGCGRSERLSIRANLRQSCFTLAFTLF